MTISITVVGETIVDIYKSLGIADAKVTTASTEQLVDELRRRMRPQGMVVNIDPADEPEADAESQAGEETAHSEATAPAPDKPKRGRPSTKDKEKAAAAEKMNGQPAATASRDDVIAALNAYAATHGGQVAGRQKMQDVCGTPKLQDIKPEDYGKLLAALRE